jgi:hypothetical protein
MFPVLEDCWAAGQVLRPTDDKGDSGGRNCLAGDVAAPAGTTGMIRTLAVTGVLLVATGMTSPPGASAQTSAQGQAVGILFLLGASKAGAQASTRTSGQKPKPGIAASPEAQAKIGGAKPKPLAAKDGSGLVRVGGGTAVSILDKVARPADPLDRTVVRVTTDQRNGQKLDQPVEPAVRTRAKHN